MNGQIYLQIPAGAGQAVPWNRGVNSASYGYLIEMRQRNLSGLLVESALIVFSVLFALFIDAAAEQATTDRQKRVALERIYNELVTNHKLVTDVIDRHRLVLRNLDHALGNKGDTLWRRLMQKEYLDFQLLSGGKSLYPRFPSRTSWEAALSTGIISEFDYGVVEALTGVYSSQETIGQMTLQKIIDDLFDVEAPDRGLKLLKLKLEFEELISQERTLLERIEDSRKRLEKLYHLSPPKPVTDSRE